MATSDLQNKIKTETEEIVQELLASAKKDSQRIATESELEVKNLKTQSEEKIKLEAEEVFKQALAKIKQNHRQALTELKRQLIEEVLTEAKLKFHQQSAEIYLAWLESGLREIPADFAGEIQLADKYPTEARNLIARIRPEAEVKISSELSDGLIASDKIATWQLTFDQLLNHRRSQLETELYHLLFS